MRELVDGGIRLRRRFIGQNGDDLLVGHELAYNEQVMTGEAVNPEILHT